jgi:hypothetical protein
MNNISALTHKICDGETMMQRFFFDSFPLHSRLKLMQMSGGKEK